MPPGGVAHGCSQSSSLTQNLWFRQCKISRSLYRQNYIREVSAVIVVMFHSNIGIVLGELLSLLVRSFYE